jgi:hypothetical protein
VAECPQHTDQRSGREAPFSRHDGGHGHEVIRIGGVLQPEHEAEDEWCGEYAVRHDVTPAVGGEAGTPITRTS